MGRTIVSMVISGLSEADIRADEAYPGRRIPALTGAVAAVRLGKVDRAVRTTAVQVVVMSPAQSGGSLCESTALKAVEVLQTMGATCVKDVCKFDEMADVFYIDITAEFLGTALDGDWSSGPGYAIKIGLQAMDHVVNFSASRQLDAETAEDRQWRFTMEELLPPGTSEPADPAEPFSLTISRRGGEELFAGCVWTAVKRVDTLRGISQVRSGTASSRTVMGVL